MIFELMPVLATQDGGTGLWFLAILVLMFLLAPIFSAIHEQTPEMQELRAQERARKESQQRIAAEQAAAAQQQWEEHQWRCQREAERQAARDTVEQFYAAHRHYLQADWPPERLAAFLNASIRPETAPADAWGLSRDLIGQLAPIVREAHEREEQRLAEQEAERQIIQRKLAELDDQLAEEHFRREQWAASSLEAEVEDELHAVSERIRGLEEHRALLAQHASLAHTS